MRKISTVTACIIGICFVGWAQLGAEGGSRYLVSSPGLKTEISGNGGRRESSTPFREPGGALEAVPLAVKKEAETREMPSAGEVRMPIGVGSSLLQLFQVADVVVRGNNRLTGEEIVAESGLTQRPWLWQFSAPDIERRIRKHPWVESVRVTSSILRRRVEIFVKEVDPWVVLEIGVHSWLVGRNGTMVLPLSRIQEPRLIVELSELPRVDGVDDFTYTGGGTFGSVSSRVREALSEVRRLEEGGGMPFAVARYTVLPDGGLLVTPLEPVGLQGVKFISDDVEKARMKLGHLAELLKSLPGEGRGGARVIDLRFSNQAVLY